MIAIVDYGAGNLFSVKNALDYLGISSIFTSDKSELEKADGILLPGVGAFPDAMRMLQNTTLIATIKAEALKKPFLGICLGMQLLFEAGNEFEETSGLSLLPGRIEPIKTGYKIPHMGYNSLEIKQECPLLDGIDEGEYVYFVHSFMAYTTPDCIAADCDYGIHIPALVQKGMIFGAQFHPEKSGDTGLRILKNFGGLTK